MVIGLAALGTWMVLGARAAQQPFGGAFAHAESLLPYSDGLFLRVGPLVETMPGEYPSAAVAARTEPVEYRVLPGETLSHIAQRFGLRTESLVWANGLSSVDILRIDQRLLIPPLDGVLHTVASGETLSGIAARYNADVEAILEYAPELRTNPDALVVGQAIMVPGGRIEAPRRVVADRSLQRPTESAAAAPSVSRPASSGYAWPTFGPIFTYFSQWHRGIDISPPYGTPVYASADGVVVGTIVESWGLGWHVIVDHGDGYTTTYAHLSSFGVAVGERVGQGEMVGRVGSTGQSTGPHVHFEVRRNGAPLNPLNFLP